MDSTCSINVLASKQKNHTVDNTNETVLAQAIIIKKHYHFAVWMIEFQNSNKPQHFSHFAKNFHRIIILIIIMIKVIQIFPKS